MFVSRIKTRISLLLTYLYTYNNMNKLITLHDIVTVTLWFMRNFTINYVLVETMTYLTTGLGRIRISLYIADIFSLLARSNFCVNKSKTRSKFEISPFLMHQIT